MSLADWLVVLKTTGWVRARQRNTVSLLPQLTKAPCTPVFYIWLLWSVDEDLAVFLKFSSDMLNSWNLKNRKCSASPSVCCLILEYYDYWCGVWISDKDLSVCWKFSSDMLETSPRQHVCWLLIKDQDLKGYLDSIFEDLWYVKQPIFWRLCFKLIAADCLTLPHLLVLVNHFNRIFCQIEAAPNCNELEMLFICLSISVLTWLF